MTETPHNGPGTDKRSDEQRTFDQVNAIIEILLAADPETRRRIYDTVGAFFGYDELGPSGQR
ncbi:MAG: hypothetical protein ETSY1_46980 (plasmid) [Candidatus Entotheonella factor]|uniref:Uncharacterized protein n=1 Tax=Entotheonella factor TaxID=1429438 RepID=W4LZJ7_ENTF1|nr:MAG: hypothetical protein ETSY1_46980 [Candidatus Entotheonella factor]